MYIAPRGYALLITFVCLALIGVALVTVMFTVESNLRETSNARGASGCEYATYGASRIIKNAVIADSANWPSGTREDREEWAALAACAIDGCDDGLPTSLVPEGTTLLSMTFTDTSPDTTGASGSGTSAGLIGDTFEAGGTIHLRDHVPTGTNHGSAWADAGGIDGLGVVNRTVFDAAAGENRATLTDVAGTNETLQVKATFTSAAQPGQRMRAGLVVRGGMGQVDFRYNFERQRFQLTDTWSSQTIESDVEAWPGATPASGVTLVLEVNPVNRTARGYVNGTLLPIEVASIGVDNTSLRGGLLLYTAWETGASTMTASSFFAGPVAAVEGGGVIGQLLRRTMGLFLSARDVQSGVECTSRVEYSVTPNGAFFGVDGLPLVDDEDTVSAVFTVGTLLTGVGGRVGRLHNLSGGDSQITILGKTTTVISQDTSDPACVPAAAGSRPVGQIVELVANKPALVRPAFTAPVGGFLAPLVSPYTPDPENNALQFSLAGGEYADIDWRTVPDTSPYGVNGVGYACPGEYALDMLVLTTTAAGSQTATFRRFFRITIPAVGAPANLTVRLLIQGYYDAGSGVMKSTLVNQYQSPRGAAPSDSDVVTIELRDAGDPSQIVASRLALLDTAGRAGFSYPHAAAEVYDDRLSTSVCGNAVTDPGELCDQATPACDLDGPTNFCTWTTCNNGQLDAGEGCDDSNGIDSDSCSNTCVINGSIVRADLVPLVIAGAAGNSYWIEVKHRSALETWSSAPVAFTATTNYDFTTGLGKAFGDNQVDVGNGRFGVWGGDVNQDGAIDDADYNQVDAAAGLSLLGQFVEDVTGDGEVEVEDVTFEDSVRSIGPSVQRPPGA